MRRTAVAAAAFVAATTLIAAALVAATAELAFGPVAFPALVVVFPALALKTLARWTTLVVLASFARRRAIGGNRVRAIGWRCIGAGFAELVAVAPAAAVALALGGIAGFARNFTGGGGLRAT